MGIFGAIAEGVVAIKYTANVDEAVAAVKGLSGEQKKAAKQAVEAHKQEREVFKKKVEEFGKGAAIIGGALLVARNGLQAYREESRLMAGAAGVDIDSLSEKWGGLKSRMDLLTLAQAGHQGAWKLTTAQLEKVSEGMRALEKKGFDTAQVFDKFTDVIKKGKLEGLDDFGLAIKSTGDQTKDLQVLMRALGREVLDVGGDFTKAGDEVVRASVRMEDGINRVRSIVGKFSTEVIQAAADFGENLGRSIGGNLTDPQSWQFNASDQYAYNFARRRAGQPMVPNGSVSAAAAFASGDAQDADFAAAAALGRFRAQVRQAKSGNGPLGTLAPNDFQDVLSTLPQGWREVDPVLGAMADNLRDQLQLRMQTVGVDAAKSVWIGFKTEFAKNAADVARSRGGGRGRAANDNLGPGLFFGAVDTVTGAVERLAGLEDARAAGAAASQARLDALGNAGMQSDFADARDALAKMQEEFAGVTRAAELNKADEESFLARTFGPLEEFDAYASAMKMLGDITQSVWGDVLDAIINGEELSAKRIGKAIGSVIGAKAKELGADGVIAILRGGLHTLTGDPRGPGEMAIGAAMVAGSLALAGIAKELGGGGGSGVAASAAGVPSGSPGGARPAPQSGVVIVGDPLSDDSPRERQRRVRRAINAAGRPNEGVRYG
jgi:hypothetical protein